MYPTNWARCHCGDFVLDGHLTCGRAECDESAARERIQRLGTNLFRCHREGDGTPGQHSPVSGPRNLSKGEH
jgi:hypothetical protein